MPILRMYADDTDKVIAESPEDAMVLWEATYGVGYTRDTGRGHEAWAPVPVAKQVTLHFPDDEGGGSETRPASEWVAKEGRCWFSSTEY